MRGGTDVVRYYLSADWDDNTAIVDYNTHTATNLRANVSVVPSESFNVDVSMGYIDGFTSFMQQKTNWGVWEQAQWANPLGRETRLRGFLQARPEEIANVEATRDNSRFTGSMTLKPPYGRITAIDLHTGEHLWMIPNGDTPERVRNHPALAGVDVPTTGKQAHATLLALPRVLLSGEGRGGDPLMRALDPATGAELARLELPAPTNAAPMTFLHEGVQYVVVAVASGQVPGELVAIRLR